MGTLGALFRRMGLPKDSLESLMGRKDPSGKSSFKPGVRTMKYLPGMLWFLLTNLNLGKKFRGKIILLDKATDVLQQEIITAAPEQFRDLFDRLHALAREAAYWNIVIPLTMQISNRFLQRKMERKGEDFNYLDFPADFPELVQYDPQYHLEALSENWRRIPEATRSTITGYNDLLSAKAPPELLEFRTGLMKMIESFGHFSESGNDFSSEPWHENPGFLFEMIRNRDEKKQSFTRKEKGIIAASIKKSKAYRRAGHYRLYREMISASYTRTYGLFRTLFLVTGKHFAAHGYLDQPGDVFYLTLEEHNLLLEGSGVNLHAQENDGEESAAWRTGVAEDANGKADDRVNEIREKVEQVKNEMARFADISLPSVIYGETPPPIATPSETLLRGIPVSPGVFEGEIVVVNGYKDFNKAVDGKILVIPFSDVGWTPILSHAGAIVTESGGMLSHASIIARELGIPAISSVDHACQLRDGTHATIDGYNGTLTL
jgi:pyruvate,water dikinase